MPAHVHWYEGLFLQPHHLQCMQRNLLEAVASERRLGWAWPYGLVEARLSADALENLLIQFDSLRAVMPSGTVVDCPAAADVPALNIQAIFESSSGSFNVGLGVPLWYATQANALERGAMDDWRVKRMYRVVEDEWHDENTGENPQPLLKRKINARLLLPDDDRSDLEVIPLLRIAHATGEDVGLPRQDPGYVPPCLVLRGSPVLTEMVRDLANQVEASRSELVTQITRGGFSIDQMRGIQFEQIMRLRTLNGYAGRLPHMVQAPSLSPFEIYLELRGLLGELAALQPDRDQYEVPPYDHDNPLVCFADLCNRIRGLLRGTVAPSFVKIDLNREGRLMVADLTDEHLTRPNEYFLGIKTGEDPRTLGRLVEDPDKFKLMARSLANQRIWGIRLAEERHPPLELPASSGLHYFRLMRADSARMWERIKQEKSIAARWEGIETADFAIALYMTVPEGGKK
ncbi:MAG TPA: type VI secretion system baseplate subunit TssK [Phycisphaerae bacterium]|nr:type VI secretion system baseplate subunit TssK [Phycisphaerae bacterium]HUU22588.1 type VI secretion system baseplate subunit TssK [Phycisphaerae bacterium]